MAKADSVPTAVQAPITGATAKASTKHPADLVGGRIPGSFTGDDEPAFRRLWQDMHPEVEREDLPLGVAINGRDQCWYEAITGRMPVGWYIAAVCYATAVILLGWLPWNALLILLLFSNSKRLRFDAFDTMPSDRLGSSQ